MSRRPLGARRDRAARYLVVTIAAFAVTVAGVRWYLDLSGYPTIGGGVLVLDLRVRTERASLTPAQPES